MVYAENKWIESSSDQQQMLASDDCRQFSRAKKCVHHVASMCLMTVQVLYRIEENKGYIYGYKRMA